MNLAGCFSLEVCHADLVRWELGLQPSEACMGLEVQDATFTWLALMPAVGPPTLVD